MQDPIAVCEKTKADSLYPWRCVRAAEHGGDCKWPIESRYYNRPLTEHDAAWLASEVSVLLARIERLQHEHLTSSARLERQHGLLMRGLIKLAPANSTRKNVPTAAVQQLWQEARG